MAPGSEPDNVLALTKKLEPFVLGKTCFKIIIIIYLYRKND